MTTNNCSRKCLYLTHLIIGHLQFFAEGETKNLLESGYIEELDKPMPFCNPLHVSEQQGMKCFGSFMLGYETKMRLEKRLDCQLEIRNQANHIILCFTWLHFTFLDFL